MASASFFLHHCNKPYAIVQFEELDKEGKLCIDLVLKKWLTKRGKKNMCKYPPHAEYHLRDRYLKQLKSPEKSWSCVPFTYITGAETLEQGRRRLYRAQFTRDCRTDVSDNTEKSPSLLSKSEVYDILHKKVPMPSTSATTKYPKKSLIKEIENCDEKETLFVDNNNMTSSQNLQVVERNTNLESEQTTNDLSIENAQLYNKLTKYIDKKLDSLRDRMRYDINTKFAELKNAILSTNLTSGSNFNLTNTRLAITLPIETDDEFLNYENILENNEDEVEALRLFFRTLIYTQTKANTCIATIMTATLSKEIELKYSGFGRSVGGTAKKNFKKLGEGLETQNLQSKISKWLAGAKDRKGGRKER
ncbi:hypothetical protein PUN28_009841 [Cardiocondyla obscurior]|uniref:DUF4806 domain-containing protein n=1 Tax=Cardiocondyla obscurior TaxID=286306 RepID=A0AAW2FRE3_9HYME